MESKIRAAEVENTHDSNSKTLRSAKVHILEETAFMAVKNENSGSPAIRKAMPQTSILAKKLKEAMGNGFEYDSEENVGYDHEIESLTLPGLKKVVVSKELRVIIAGILDLFAGCRFKQDPFKSHADIYKYLFDSDRKRVRSANDFYKPPDFLIISQRYRIFSKDLSLPAIKNLSVREPAKSYQFIDMSRSVISLKSSSPIVVTHRSPLCVLKKVTSRNELLIPVSYSGKVSEQFSSPRSIKGKKVDQGNGGFRKPKLIFEKHKNSSSVFSISDSKTEKKLPKVVLTPKIFKDSATIHEICAKYGISREEYLEIIGEYEYIKGNSKGVRTENVAKAYSISLNLFRGLEPTFTVRKYITLEEFVRFYIVVISKKAGFVESFEFILNYLGVSSVDQLRVVQFKETSALSALFNEKISRLIQLFQKNKKLTSLLTNSTIKNLQKSGISLQDLKTLISLIASSLN